MKMRVFLLISLLLIPALGYSGLLDNDPFLMGKEVPAWSRGREILLYRISFFGIPAGYAEFSFIGEEEEKGKELYHIRARFWTSGLVKIFKEIHDEFHYFMDKETLYPYKMIVKQRESKRNVDKVVYYDQKTGVMSHFSMKGEKLKEYRAVPGIFEPVTLAYYMRSLNLSQGIRNIKVYGGKKVYLVEVKPLGKEKVKTELGIFDTLKVDPIMRYKGKVKQNRGITAWLINDGSNIPLLVHAKLKVGTLTGNLIQLSKGQKNEQ